MDKLNSKHLIFIIMGTTIVTLKTNPTSAIKYAGRDTWIAVIIAAILLLTYTLYIISVCRKTNLYSISKIYKYSLGTIAGNIFLFLFIITLFLTLVESCSFQSASMHVNMLNETPVWYIGFFFVTTAIYSVKKNIRTIITITIIGITLIMIAGINLAILTQKYKKTKYLLPILAKGIDQNFLISILIILGCLSSIAIIFPYLSDIGDKNNLSKNVVIGLIIVIQMQIIAMIGTITSFGANRAVNIFFPKLIQTQLVNYFGILESGELFVMLQIIGGWFIKYILTFYALLKLLKEMNIYNKYLTYIISLLVFIFSSYISRNIFLFFNLFDYYVYIALINFIIIPLLVFIILSIRYKLNK